MSNEWNKSFWIAGSKKPKDKEPRYPVDDPEGILNQYDENGIRIVAGYKEDGTPMYTGAVSLTKIEILDLISEGRIEGLVEGTYIFVGTTGNIGYTSFTLNPYPVAKDTTKRWLRSIFWNNVPLVDDSDEPRYNFSNIDVSYSKGDGNGSLVDSKNNELTVTRSLGERLRGPRSVNDVLVGSINDYSKTYRIYNNTCNAVYLNVKIGQLSKRNVTIPPKDEEGQYGDVEITSIDYQIQYRPMFANSSDKIAYGNPFLIKIEGRMSYGYIKSDKIPFVRDNSIFDWSDFIGWEILIIRTTPESQTTVISNQTVIDSLTEVYGYKFSYPNSALVRCNFNAEYFTQIPERAFHVNLLKILIPSNYNPILRSYTSDWDGTFGGKQWSNNPAWCFYDLVTNRRYGLGRFFNESTIDKWTLYQ